MVAPKNKSTGAPGRRSTNYNKYGPAAWRKPSHHRHAGKQQQQEQRRWIRRSTNAITTSTTIQYHPHHATTRPTPTDRVRRPRRPLTLCICLLATVHDCAYPAPSQRCRAQRRRGFVTPGPGPQRTRKTRRARVRMREQGLQGWGNLSVGGGWRMSASTSRHRQNYRGPPKKERWGLAHPIRQWPSPIGRDKNASTGGVGTLPPRVAPMNREQSAATEKVSKGGE